jgi:hypothetical protein
MAAFPGLMSECFDQFVDILSDFLKDKFREFFGNQDGGLGSMIKGLKDQIQALIDMQNKLLSELALLDDLMSIIDALFPGGIGCPDVATLYGDIGTKKGSVTDNLAVCGTDKITALQGALDQSKTKALFNQMSKISMG